MSDELRETTAANFEIMIPFSFGQYRYIKTLGKGSFSIVVLVCHKLTKQLFACKVVSREQLTTMNVFLQFEQEVRLMETLDHPNVVKVHEVLYRPKEIMLIMDYCSQGELFKHIVTFGPMVDPELRNVFRQIVEGLNYIHHKNIAHRDLKPENILFDGNGGVKIADFGLCHQTSANKLLCTPCGSPYYAPPEIINNVPYDGKAGDIWSLGVVLFTMATGKLPWSELGQTALFQQIKEVDFEIPPEASPPVQQILSMMMQKLPGDRPTAQQILQMPWLSDDELDFVKPTSLKMRREGPWSRSTQDPTASKRVIIVRPTSLTSSMKSAQMDPIMSLIRKVPKPAKLPFKRTPKLNSIC